MNSIPAENNEIIQLFEMKQKFLREIPHPKLTLKWLRFAETKGKLKPLNVVEMNEFALSEPIKAMTLIQFLEAYIQKELRFKHQISLSASYLEFRTILAELVRLQFEFISKLVLYLPSSVNDDLLKPIKVSIPFDAYKVLKSLDTVNGHENEIKDYLCKTLTQERMEETTFVTPFLRAYKIKHHGG